MSAHAAENVATGYGKQEIVHGVSLAADSGKITCIFGPNGSGKSTLLRTLVGPLEPLAGTVTFAGAPVDERVAAFRRVVAAVLDDDAFFVSLTGREHLLLTARGHGVAAPEEVVDAEVAAFGLGERADALPSALSSGQRRRLALAAAFVRPARLLVLDEPERRLDTGMRARLAARLAALRDAGTAVLLASHDADVVGTVADQVLAVDDDDCRLLDPAAAAGRIAEL